MTGKLIRILSDVHYGDQSSVVTSLEQLRPLVSDVDGLVFNGDTMDTRIGPRPEHTRKCREEVHQFAAALSATVRFHTGNHDPDFSTDHATELADGKVFVMHGDLLFDDIVPWGRDAGVIRERIAHALNGTSQRDLAALSFEERVRIWRSVAASVPQRHQSEKNLLRYALHFAVDTVWPPTRCLRVLDAWKQEPKLAAEFVRQHRPRAKYVILGHTHRPTIRRVPGGPIVINTGAYTRPFGAFAVDVLPDLLRVRRVHLGKPHAALGAIVAEFPL